jgi:Uncharacterised nucleotidyltransferase
MQTMATDLVAADVVRALRQAGVRPLLLKGPALAELLYRPGELRSYVDVDLLVAPDEEPVSGDVLRALGFEALVGARDLGGHRPLHAHEWVKEQTPSVDLHRTLPGAAADPAIVVGVLGARTRSIELAGELVETPTAPALLVHVVLHAVHHGPRGSKALEDLERALELDLDVWEDAAALAGEIDSISAFAAGLRLLPAGAALAERLDLPARAPVEIELRTSGAPPLSGGLEWLLRTPGTRAKAALLARTIVPSPGAIRLWRPLARRPRSGLVLAYLSHPFWLAWHALPSARAVRRARRRAP